MLPDPITQKKHNPTDLHGNLVQSSAVQIATCLAEKNNSFHGLDGNLRKNMEVSPPAHPTRPESPSLSEFPPVHSLGWLIVAPTRRLWSLLPTPKKVCDVREKLGALRNNIIRCGKRHGGRIGLLQCGELDIFCLLAILMFGQHIVSILHLACLSLFLRHLCGEFVDQIVNWLNHILSFVWQCAR